MQMHTRLEAHIAVILGKVTLFVEVGCHVAVELRLASTLKGKPELQRPN